MSEQKEYVFCKDERHTIWIRTKYNIMASSYEEAIAIFKDSVENCDEGDSEILFDTIGVDGIPPFYFDYETGEEIE